MPGILEPPTSLAWGLRSCHSCISRHFAPRAFTLDALWSASFSLHSLVLHDSSSCSSCAFCCSLHHGIIIKSLPCCLTCMLSHKNCSLRFRLCSLLHMYHRLFVLCRFLLEYWSSRVGNKTHSQHQILMSPLIILTDEHVPLQFLITKYFVVIIHGYI